MGFMRCSVLVKGRCHPFVCWSLAAVFPGDESVSKFANMWSEPKDNRVHMTASETGLQMSELQRLFFGISGWDSRIYEKYKIHNFCLWCSEESHGDSGGFLGECTRHFRVTSYERLRTLEQVKELPVEIWQDTPALSTG